jgi:NAD(P)-dependent dehydrogenase (short-subunit alcohol dehydrogenase family)
MENFTGKTAFITGGAAGIGLAMAQEFTRAGAQVVIADVRQEALDRAKLRLPNAYFIRLDVTDREAMARAANEAGTVHILCANAGVFLGGPTQDATYDDWDFVLGINLGGVVNTVRTFVPRMIAQGEGGHIVLTSSINGLFASGGVGPYTASKFAVTGLGECLRMNLAPHKIGVSILCPGPVASELFESTPAVRPKSLSDTGAHLVALDETDPVSREIFAGAMSIEEVGRRVMQGIRRNDFYIITHTEVRDVLHVRMKALLASLPDEPVPRARAKSAAVLYDVPAYHEQAAKPAPKPDRIGSGEEPV